MANIKLLSSLKADQDKIHEEGDTISVSDEEAKHLVRIGAAERTDGSSGDDERKVVVEDGIRYFIEGDQIAASDDATFVSLDESIVGFGTNKAEALADYQAKSSQQ